MLWDRWCSRNRPARDHASPDGDEPDNNAQYNVKNAETKQADGQEVKETSAPLALVESVDAEDAQKCQ